MCKDRIYSAPETQKFCKRAQPCCDITEILQKISTLTFSFFFEKNDTFKFFNCPADNYSFKESICALHSIPSVKEEEKEHEHVPTFYDFLVPCVKLLNIMFQQMITFSMFPAEST